MRIAKIVALALVAVSCTGSLPMRHAGDPGRQGTDGCDRPPLRGTFNVALTSAGQHRPFLLHVPSDSGRQERLPLVLNLHSTGGNAAGQMRVSEMAALADRRRFAVAAPNGAIPYGSGYAWNVPGVPLLNGKPVPAGTPSDERYLLDVIRKIKKTVCTDPRRIYLTGFSGGARMSSQMACDYPGRIAAIAPVAGLRSGVPRQTAAGSWEPAPDTCQPGNPVSVLTFHGTADTINPYAGDDKPRWGYSVETALARWAELDACRRGPTTSEVTASVDLISYSRCREGAAVRLYRRDGARHDWPSVRTWPDVDAGSLIWDFFARHALPASNCRRLRCAP